MNLGLCNTAFGVVEIAHRGDEVLGIRYIPQLSDVDEDKSAKRIWQKILSGDLPKFVMQGTAFQQKVWNALLQIPVGKTVTYQQIAQKIGHPNAVRAVGNAVGKNPFFYAVPCHRVLPANGGIGGYFWGPELKRTLLKAEGALSA